MSGPLSGIGGQAPPQQANPLDFFGKIEEYQSYMYFFAHALNPERGDYNGPVPDQAVDALKGLIKNSDGPMVDQFLTKARAQINAMDAADIRNYIIDMGKEQFVNLYGRNEGVRNVIQEAAREYVDTTPLLASFAQNGLDLQSVGFNTGTDTSVLQTTISQANPANIESFFIGLSNDETRQVLHQLNVEDANAVITQLGQQQRKDGDGDGDPITDSEGNIVYKDIDEINIPTLAENASQEDIAKRIDSAIEARTDYEAGALSAIFGNKAENEIFDNIRAGLGATVRGKFEIERAKADNMTGENIFAMIATDEEASLELLNANLSTIHEKLGEKENILFMLDSAGDLVGDGLIDFIDQQMQQYPIIAQFAPMILNILHTVAGIFGMDLNNPPQPEASDIAPEVAPPDPNNSVPPN